jgi:ankyrin repeat protein
MGTRSSKRAVEKSHSYNASSMSESTEYVCVMSQPFYQNMPPDTAAVQIKMDLAIVGSGKKVLENFINILYNESIQLSCNLQNVNGHTILHQLIIALIDISNSQKVFKISKKCHFLVVKFLKTYDFTLCDNQGWDVISLVTKNAYIDKNLWLIQIILQMYPKENINMIGPDGLTPLLRWAGHSNTMYENIESLLGSGSDITKVDRYLNGFIYHNCYLNLFSSIA